MIFSTLHIYFSYVMGASAPIHAVLKLFWPVLRTLELKSVCYGVKLPSRKTFQVQLYGPHNILYKPLAAFPYNHGRNNGQQWERNESCRNDYHQSLERISAEPEVLTLYHTIQTFNDLEKEVLKTLWEKEKMLVTSNKFQVFGHFSSTANASNLD